MRTLIVNADDFGLSASVNAGIVHAHVAGIVTSTTLLANGAAFVEAVALARRHPTLGVGVHLDLVEGRPLSAPATVGSLVDPDGAFVGSTPALAARAVRGRLAYPELVAEASAQLARVVDAARVEPGEDLVRAIRRDATGREALAKARRVEILQIRKRLRHRRLRPHAAHRR